MTRPVVLASFAIVAAILGGGAMCARSDTGTVNPSTTSTGSGPEIRDSEDLNPGAPPPRRAVVTASGTPFPVETKVEREGTKYLLRLSKDGTEIDREEYEASVMAFRLVMAGGERYRPTIDLLRFPMRLGDRWDWKGQILANGHPVDATATVETSEDNQYIEGAPIKAVRTRVTLKFPALGGDESAERVLTFWFAPGKGLFKRDFGGVSIREPGTTSKEGS